MSLPTSSPLAIEPLASAVVSCAQSAAGVQLAGALHDALFDLEQLLSTLPRSVLVDTSLDSAFASTIGKHVRHTIDHVRALRVATTDGIAPYEARMRADAAEQDAVAACEQLASLRSFLRSITTSTLNADIAMEQATLRDAPPLILRSTFIRELGFVYSHTIHHLAIIRMMLTQCKQSITISPTFGYAPGTPQPR